VHVLFQVAGLFEYGVVDVSTAADFGHFITAHCAGDGKNLVHVSFLYLRFIHMQHAACCIGVHLHDQSIGSGQSAGRSFGF
jgi:hypothetical protein